MNLTTEMLANYLRKTAGILLGDLPFKNWDFEKSVENDLPKIRIDYVLPNDGMDSYRSPRNCFGGTRSAFRLVLGGPDRGGVSKNAPSSTRRGSPVRRSSSKSRRSS